MFEQLLEKALPHVPVIVVIAPLLGGLFSALIGRKGLGWAIAMLTSLISLTCSVYLLQEVVWGESINVQYRMGNWPKEFGILYLIDPLNAAVLTIVSLIGTLCTFYARLSIPSEIPKEKLHFFYAVWQFCLVGLLGITITGDAFNLYVLLEISSLATYTLVAMGKGRNRRALTASINYLVLGTIGASFILLGIGYLYMITGTLNMAEMAIELNRIQATWSTDAPEYHNAMITGFAFLIVGLSLKLALFPLHTWLPNAYTYSPSAVSALLAATATKVGAYICIRFIYSIVGTDFAFSAEIPTNIVLMVSAGGAIMIGSFLAIRQANVKKLLAYSSIAQIGYIALGFALANENGLTASIIHIFNHALTKGGMFLALGIVAYRVGGTNLKDLRGLGRRMPFTMAAFTAGGLGLIGVPLTAGFISKWYLVAGTIEAGYIYMAGIVLVGSLLALIYVWKVIEVIYFGKRPEDAPEVKEGPWSMVLPTWILIGGSLYFGIDANLSTEVARKAANMLLGGGV